MNIPQAQNAYESAQEHLEHLLADAFPEGMEVTFRRGRGIWRGGVVLCVCLWERVRVRMPSGHCVDPHWSEFLDDDGEPLIR